MSAVISPNKQYVSSTPNELGVDDLSLCAAQHFSKVRRKRYSVREKLAILKKVERMVEDDKVSLRTAAGLFYLSPSQITRWRKMERQLTEYTSKKAKAMNAGPKSKFGEEGFENELLKWIFEEREKGVAVTNLSMLIVACPLSRNFKAKMFLAQYSAIERFVKKYSLVYRLDTCELQRKLTKRHGHGWKTSERSCSSHNIPKITS